MLEATEGSAELASPLDEARVVQGFHLGGDLRVVRDLGQAEPVELAVDAAPGVLAVAAPVSEVATGELGHIAGRAAVVARGEVVDEVAIETGFDKQKRGGILTHVISGVGGDKRFVSKKTKLINLLGSFLI